MHHIGANTPKWRICMLIIHIHVFLFCSIYVVANYALAQSQQPCEIQAKSQPIKYTTLGPPPSPILKIVGADLYQVWLANQKPHTSPAPITQSQDRRSRSISDMVRQSEMSDPPPPLSPLYLQWIGSKTSCLPFVLIQQIYWWTVLRIFTNKWYFIKKITYKILSKNWLRIIQFDGCNISLIFCSFIDFVYNLYVLTFRWPWRGTWQVLTRTSVSRASRS